MGGFLLLLPVVAGLSLGQGEPAPGDARAPAPLAPAAAPSPRPSPTAPAKPSRSDSPLSPAPAEPSQAPAPAPGRDDARPGVRRDKRDQGSSPTRAQPAPAPDDRTQVAKTALAFLDALVARNADALAAACSERFSFDGEVRTGRDAVRRTWRELLSRRAAPQDALLDLEILPAADAVARLGPAPARVAPLAARGAWIGIANVSGRAVILFLAREGGRWTVAGLHD